METYQTMGDLLLRRYVTDYISRTQQLSAPTYSRLKENSNYAMTGDGIHFSIEIDGNESGGQWRARGNNQLSIPQNERTKRAQVYPKKYYHVVTFDGLAEAVSARGGEDAFVAGITYALSQAVRRAGANFETTFLRGDGTGRLGNYVSGTGTTTIGVTDARVFRPGQVIVFLNNTTGLRIDGPVTVTGRSVSAGTITTSSAVTAATTDGIYIAGEQSEAAPPAETTMLGLPALVSNTGSIYGYSRVTYPSLQSKIIAASGSLDESMLRRLRKQLMVETAVDTLEGYAMISNHDQFDRYTEIALPFRRFLDNRLELGAQQELTSFEGRPWYITWAADPTRVYFLNLGALERGTVRPLSIDERVNMA